MSNFHKMFAAVVQSRIIGRACYVARIDELETAAEFYRESSIGCTEMLIQ